MAESIEVRLVNSLTGEELSGGCQFWLGGRYEEPVCTPNCVARAIYEFNTGGLTHLLSGRLETWDQAVVFFLPNTVVPLGRFTDLGEHIVRDENGRNWLTLEVVLKKQ